MCCARHNDQTWGKTEERETIITVRELEETHKMALAQEIGRALLKARKQLCSCLLEKTKSILVKCRRSFHVFGRKPGRLLAKPLRWQQMISFFTMHLVCK